MSYKIIKKLPTYNDMIAKYPLSSDGYNFVEQHKLEIRNILSGEDDRLLLMVGPCSAWPYDAVIDYANRIISLNELIKHKIKLVMRTYIQKPRTVSGWNGPILQPDPLNLPNIEAGMDYARKLMVEITEKNLAISNEILFTHNIYGFVELLSWAMIGARSSEDQEHRVFASSIDCPVGIKNPTSGSVKIGINGVISAQNHHIAAFNGYEVETKGNEYAHLVLRGGSGKPNYSLEHLEQAMEGLKVNNIKNPAIVIDVSHDNCLINGVKHYEKQGEIIFEILRMINENPHLKGVVKGFMLESFIKPGKQNIEAGYHLDMGGLSITDPCLGWEETKILLLDLIKAL